MWAALNAFTFVLAAATYAIIRSWIDNPLWAEAAAFFWVMLANIVDMGELITDREIIKDRIQSFLSRPETDKAIEVQQPNE